MNYLEISRWLRASALQPGPRTLACAIAAVLCSPALVHAKEVGGAANLGAGLNDMIANSPSASSGDRVKAQAAPVTRTRVPASSRGTSPNARTGDQTGLQAPTAASDLKITSPVRVDSSGRALVRITLDGKVSLDSMMQGMRGMGGIEVTGSSATYGAGAIEAYVPVEMLQRVAREKGVQAVVAAGLMRTNVGATDTQGLVQHRVNKVPAGVDGSGITIGVLSDSYDTAFFVSTFADDDIATGDLPGPGNPVNAQPVVVLQDSGNPFFDTDEGRGMLQIVHDVAPKSRLGFATANGGELNFADNIRSLAGLSTGSKSVPGFKADIVVDDVIYFAEPFFQDGVVAQAVDDVAAAGVSYFSSAGNQPASEAYDSPVRIVPANAASMQGTNLNFSGVDPALFAGGFHDFAPDRDVVDIAQTIQVFNGAIMDFQWNEIFDPQPPKAVGAPLASGVSTVPAGGNASFTFNATAGQAVNIFVDEDTTTTGIPNPDLTFALIGPDNQLIQFVDTGTNPETLTLPLTLTGTYTVVVDSFLASQSGDFLFRVQPVEVVEQVVTDFNLLFFTASGQFVAAVAENNLFTNRPIELVQFPTATLQMVIARANTPERRNRNAADRIRYVSFGGVVPQEYFSYLGSVTFGHSSAQGGISTAAYPFFAPFVPESFTSPGPSTIYFDKNNRRMRNPEVRQKPDLAAMDGANTTFFGGDSDVDADDFPNFFGTSAAAPHAAAIAALVLDAAGGPGRVKPNKMREILQDSAFRHDLDPYFSSGFDLSLGNLLAVNATGDGNATSQLDPNFFTLTQVGLRPLLSFSINGTGGNPTQTPPNVVFDTRLGAGLPFTIGTSVGLTPADVTATFTLPADPPGLAGQFKQLNLSFRNGAFRAGDLLRFGVDRDEADVAGLGGAAGGNSADLLGGGVLIPSGELAPGGARFFGTFDNNRTFKGEFFNLIGKGYSQLDGFGFINAEAAVDAVSKGRRGK